VDPVTTFNEEEFKHLEWDKDVAVYEDTYVPPEPPAEPVAEPTLTAEEGLYVTVGADGSLVAADGAIFAVLANGTLKSADGSVFAPTGVVLSAENALVSAALAFEGTVALADGIKLEEGRKFVIKKQQLGEGEMLLSFLGGAEFVDGAGRLFRRAADGTFLGADLDNLEAWTYSGSALTAKDSKRITGDMQQGASEWKWVVGDVELERGAKITVKAKSKTDGGGVLLLKSDGTLVDGAGGVYSVTPEGLLVGPDGVVFGATGLLMTPAGVAQNAAVSFSDGAVLANGSGVAAGSKIVVKKQIAADEGMVVMVGADGQLQGLDGTKYTMRSDGKLVSEGKKVFKSTGKVVTADQQVLTGVTAAVDESGKVISINGTPLMAGAKIVIHQDAEATRAFQEEMARKEAEEKAVKEAAEKAAKEAAEKEKAEKEAKEKAEREAKEKAEREAKEKAEREAKEKAEREAKEAAEKAAKEAAEKEAAEKAAAAAAAKKKKEEEEELEPPPKPVTIKGEVTLKDAKGDVFAEVHKDDAAGTIIGAESVIIIKNAKGKEVVRITRGYVTVKNFNVEEIVQIMRGVVSVKTMAGKEMVHVEKGEIYIEDFDGEVIVNNLADVNKLDDEMSLKNL